MKRYTYGFFILIAFFTGIIYSCRKDFAVVTTSHQATLIAIESIIPRGFPASASDLNLRSDNPLTIEGVALGRRLFYDKK